ncbi:ribokinase isoform X1 [Cimex lectularius]|uniref:Ribokinase n=1 Tax=Cimex lectularius TaxID=79782 RepID=A0A8I6RCC9_CIMLE|nr:ribokinase isoform X1 [Cimex lectularius]
MGQHNFDVVVVGSCMIDFVCYTPRIPKIGETIHGNNFEVGHGGKGANQCVAAARLGASTALIARVGDDDFGKKYIKELKNQNINTEFSTITENHMSGMAQITVTENGDNCIVIVAGSNNKLCFEDVKKAENVLLNSKIVLFQLETPLETTIKTLEFIRKNGGPVTFVNGAPAISNFDLTVLKLCDVFCVNETEASAIVKVEILDIATGKAAVEKLLELGCKMAILTMGAQGVIFGDSPSNIQHVPTKLVTPVDTTGAGDCFVGAYGFYTANFPSLSTEEKIKRCAFIASESVLKKGTQSSYPLRCNLPDHLFISLE